MDIRHDQHQSPIMQFELPPTCSISRTHVAGKFTTLFLERTRRHEFRKSEVKHRNKSGRKQECPFDASAQCIHFATKDHPKATIPTDSYKPIGLAS
jgi:hypothetical protein